MEQADQLQARSMGTGAWDCVQSKGRASTTGDAMKECLGRTGRASWAGFLPDRRSLHALASDAWEKEARAPPADNGRCGWLGSRATLQASAHGRFLTTPPCTPYSVRSIFLGFPRIYSVRLNDIVRRLRFELQNAPLPLPPAGSVGITMQCVVQGMYVHASVAGLVVARDITARDPEYSATQKGKACVGLGGAQTVSPTQRDSAISCAGIMPAITSTPYVCT